MTREPRQPNGTRYDYTSLCLATSEMLEEVMRLGVPPKLESLAGWEFKGYNTLELTALVGVRKFKKGFYEEPGSSWNHIRGYNVKVEQNTLGEPWVDVLRMGMPIRFGWYEVYPVRLDSVDCKYPNAVLIDYNCPKNFPLDPARMLRDYLVQVYEDNPDLYLGKAYVAAGPLRLFLSYFVLERSNRSSLP